MLLWLLCGDRSMNYCLYSKSKQIYPPNILTTSQEQGASQQQWQNSSGLKTSINRLLLTILCLQYALLSSFRYQVKKALQIGKTDQVWNSYELRIPDSDNPNFQNIQIQGYLNLIFPSK